MSNYSLSLSRSPTQDSNVLETFEANKHLLESKTTPLKSDKAQRKTSQNLFEISEDKDLDNAGDFRSQDCVELLKQSDIVVTNPPFSLFREYVAQLVEYNKKFVIIMPLGGVNYKEIFPLIRDNKIWLGYGFKAGNAFFRIPQLDKKFASGVYDEKTGLVKFRNVTWLTNLDIKKRHELLETVASYKKNPEKYPKYDNFNAIDVESLIDIPFDYDGIMGVPITFLSQYNPKQFQIIGSGTGNNAKEIGVKVNYRGRTDIAYTKNGVSKCPYARILIQKRKESK